MKFKIILFLGISLIWFLGCSSTKLMQSSLANNEIKIDGNHEDWSGKLRYFEDERTAIGFQNDNENLFFCFVTSDKSNAMQIMSLGLTVWFEQINDEQKIGLQYPKLMNKEAPKKLMGINKNQNENTDFEGTVKKMMQSQGEFLLVDEKSKIIYSSPIGSNDGYEIKVGTVNQQFVYEAKIPIANNSIAQMPINIFPDEKINIKFESGEINFEEMKKNNIMQEGMDKSNGGLSDTDRGNTGRGGSRMQGVGSNGSPNRFGRFKLDVEVKLTK